MITLVLVEDETAMRKALATVLNLEDDLQVIGETGDSTMAADLIDRLRPDVLVTDLEMPEMDGLALARQVLERVPDQAVLMLTRHMRPGILRRALSAGVRGFIGKDSDPADIAATVRTVAVGGRHIDSTIAAEALRNDCPLTERELDALREARGGVSIRQIAGRLHLAPGTVSNYLSDAMHKLDCDNRHAAARAAFEHGWI